VENFFATSITLSIALQKYKQIQTSTKPLLMHWYHHRSKANTATVNAGSREPSFSDFTIEALVSSAKTDRAVLVRNNLALLPTNSTGAQASC